MTQTQEETVVALTGAIYSALDGEPFPTGLDDPAGEWTEHGLTTPDGVVFTYTRNTTDLFAWQTSDVIRRLLESVVTSVQFALEQMNSENVVFAYGGGAVTDEGSFAEFAPPDPEELEDRTMIVDFEDTYHYRLLFPKGSVTGEISTQLIRTNFALLPVTFSPVRKDQSTKIFRLRTDDPAFSPTS